jgi:hypothetical protein
VNRLQRMPFFAALAGAIVLPALGCKTFAQGLVPLTGDSSVVILDLATSRTLGRIKPLSHPQDVVIGPDSLAFVLEMGGDARPGHSVAVVNVNQHRLERRIDIAPYRRPHWAQLSSDGKTLWIACEPDSAIVEVDVGRSRVTRAWRTGRAGGWMFAVTQDARKIFVAQFDEAGVTVIDRATDSRRWVPLSGHPIGIAVTPDAREVWIGATGTDSVYVLSAARGTVVARFPSHGREPARIVFTPSGDHAVVTESRADSVTIYDARSRTPLRSTFTGVRTWPKGVALNADGSVAYVSLMETGELLSVEVASGRILNRARVGAGPERVAIEK